MLREAQVLSEGIVSEARLQKRESAHADGGPAWGCPVQRLVALVACVFVVALFSRKAQIVGTILLASWGTFLAAVANPLLHIVSSLVFWALRWRIFRIVNEHVICMRWRRRNKTGKAYGKVAMYFQSLQVIV